MLNKNSKKDNINSLKIGTNFVLKQQKIKKEERKGT